MKYLRMFGIMAIAFFFISAEDGFYFPEPDSPDITYGYYTPEEIIRKKSFLPRRTTPSGTNIVFWDSAGNKLLARKQYVYKSGKLKGFYDGSVYKVGWYPNCLFKYINLNYPCAVVLSLEKNGEVILSYDESREIFDTERRLVKQIGTYGMLWFATPFIALSMLIQLFKRSPNRRY